MVQSQGDAEQLGFVVTFQWPEHQNTDAPSDTPENVSNFFRQAISSLQGGNFDAAGMMFRKTLETATKALNPKTAGDALIKRIDKLVDAGALTKDLGEWAHEVRLGGNDAAHEEQPFEQQEAEELKEFTLSFLRYAFTLPAAVARRKAAA